MRIKKLHIHETPENSQRSSLTRRIIKSYRNPVIRLYSAIRFNIIPLRFLQDISQYVPHEGRLLDIGCGFGLFSLYFAALNPDIQVFGIDRSRARIEMARRSASALEIENVLFQSIDAQDLTWQAAQYNAVLTMDLLHHLPRRDGEQLIKGVYSSLKPGGLFIMKDVTTYPRSMLYFTFALDLLLNPTDTFFYRSAESWVSLLNAHGFIRIRVHHLWDILPYPHVLILARRD